SSIARGIARLPAPAVHNSVPSMSKRIKRMTENRRFSRWAVRRLDKPPYRLTAQPPDPDQTLAHPGHARLITKQMVTADTTPRERRVHDPSRSRPECHVRDTSPFRKEQQIAGLVTPAVGRHRDLLSLAELLIAVARQLDAARGVHG